MRTLPFPTQRPTSSDDFPERGPGAIPPIILRAGARLADFLILAVPYVIIATPYVDRSSSGDVELDLPHWANITLVVVPIVYEFLFLAVLGATPGKMLTGIGVRSFVDGGRIAPYQAGLRVMVASLGGIFALLVSEGIASVLELAEPMIYLSSIFDPMLRGWHDRAAGTVVLRTR